MKKMAEEQRIEVVQLFCYSLNYQSSDWWCLLLKVLTGSSNVQCLAKVLIPIQNIFHRQNNVVNNVELQEKGYTFFPNVLKHELCILYSDTLNQYLWERFLLQLCLQVCWDSALPALHIWRTSSCILFSKLLKFKHFQTEIFSPSKSLLGFTMAPDFD